MRKYKIVSNGTPEGTYIYDPDGRELTNVIEVSYTISVNDVVGAAVIVVPAEINVETSNLRMEASVAEKEIDSTYENSDEEFVNSIKELLGLKPKNKGNDKKANLHTFAFYHDED